MFIKLFYIYDCCISLGDGVADSLCPNDWKCCCISLATLHICVISGRRDGSKFKHFLTTVLSY